jgi:MFS family permease
MLSSIGIFTAGTIICCVTNNYAVFIVGRSVQGIGGGGSFALVSVILADIIPLRQRAQYQAITSLAWSFAVITGGLVPYLPPLSLSIILSMRNSKHTSNNQQVLSSVDFFLNTQHGDGVSTSTSPSAHSNL